MPILALLLATATPAETSLEPHLQPLAFLVGSCWRGAFPGGGDRTDTHCFTRTADGRTVRDRHVVAGAAQPYSGVTVYRWDAGTGSIEFDYDASDGSHSSGTALAAANGLVFPEQSHRATSGAETYLRSSWTHDGADAYVALTESLRGEVWRKLWEIRMVRIGPAPADQGP
jgi:hypothetical protein